MVSEVCLYVEGGGGQRTTKRRIRIGFSLFLRDVVEEARKKRVRFSVVACGGRDDAFALYEQARRENPECVNLLLIDSDSPVVSSRSDHIKTKLGKPPKGLLEDRVHLMVQVMEAWFLADVPTLKTYYSKDFNASAFPASNNVEAIDKDAVLAALKQATRPTKKGEYHKIRHASELLALIRPSEVRKASNHCDCLFSTLEATIRSFP